MDRRDFLRRSGILGAGALLSSLLPVSEAVAFGRGRYRITRTRMMMGTYAAITVIGPSRDSADDAISFAFDEMQRSSALFDRHQDGSPIGTLNREGWAAGLDREVIDLVERAIRLSRTTRGFFDITVKPAVDLFESAFAAHKAPPSDAKIASVMDLVDPGSLHIDGLTIRFAKEGMGVTLDGIAKGYAVDRGMKALQDHGIEHALINAGGDLRTIGGRGRFSPWKVAVQNPNKGRPPLQTFVLKNGAVATSGNYEVYFDEEMVYHHLIHPQSARPAQGSRSVTALAASATLADGLATAVFVAGPTAGRELIETVPGAECLIVTAGDDKVSSSRWPSDGGLFNPG
jgi:thiamine biosynthesis lipoprotein